MIDLTWKIGGEAGYGIMSSGLIFAKAALRSGYFIYDLNEYPSLIRGGHNTYTVRISDGEIYSQVKPVNLLVALNQNAIDFHKDELSQGAALIVNTDKVDQEKIKISKGVNLFPVPLIKLAKEVDGKEIMMNTVAIGASMALLKGDFEVLTEVIKDFFKGKEKIEELNIKAAKLGFDFIKNNFNKIEFSFSLPKKNRDNGMLLTGNDAIALGAVKAGLKFFACYPMTPINSLLAYFAKQGPELKIVYIQPEDEISGINMAIGASFAGARSMVATSGGGFSLMTEAFGLAGITETPLVIIEGQRPGPATGLPTWGAQGDLRFVLHAAQDDFPRIVLAPGDPEECFWLTIEAFNLAEIYQAPAVILTDKHLGESHQSVADFEDSKAKIDRGFMLSKDDQLKEYKRYQFTENGISPRGIPGRKGFTFRANSDEHNEYGFSNEEAEVRKNQVEKRMRKMETLAKKIPNPNIYGPDKAEFTLIGWGSAKGPILEAQKALETENVKTNFLHLTYMNPFPSQFVADFLKGKKNVLMVEQNSTAQCAGLIRERTGITIKNHLLKYDGRPFFPEEIAEKVKELWK
ncbi:MAG: 2-oxoacid:acceptor oxidoreductase subunit alpha [Candidatus Nealsonbacteria bacterium]|nr:2-oxoacid:acceptor oxidoreductase subunit alpha [Candidatus Nealsonbacteria bacterium]